MSIAPWLVRHSVDIAKWLLGIRQSTHVDDVVPVVSDDHDLVVILGYGRVGQTIARFLKTEAVPYVVLDLDPTRVSEARRAGEPIYFGDVCKRAILKQIGIKHAKMIVITLPSSVPARAFAGSTKQRKTTLQLALTLGLLQLTDVIPH